MNTIRSNDCSRWTPATYSEVTNLQKPTRMEILQSYIPFVASDGCLESVFMRLKTLYQPNMSDRLGGCVNCVLTIIEANSCPRTFFLLENVPVMNTPSMATSNVAQCNQMSSASITMRLRCCSPPTDCSISGLRGERIQ